MASFARRDTHIKLDSRLYIPIESEPSFKCWLAVVTVVRLAGSLTTTDLSHLELVLAFDHAEDDDIWVQGFVEYELRHDFEDLVECEVWHGEVYKFAEWFLHRWDPSWPRSILWLRHYLKFLLKERSNGNLVSGARESDLK